VIELIEVLLHEPQGILIRIGLVPRLVIFDLPFDHRIAWRPALDGQQRDARGNRCLHASLSGERDAMSPREEIVFVVDNDARVRAALGELCSNSGEVK